MTVNQHAQDLLASTRETVTGQRAGDYGAAIENFSRIAAIWSELLPDPDDLGRVRLRPTDVANMMSALKSVRVRVSPDHEDSWRDKAGYAALGWQVQQEAPTQEIEDPAMSAETARAVREVARDLAAALSHEDPLDPVGMFGDFCTTAARSDYCDAVIRYMGRRSVLHMLREGTEADHVMFEVALETYERVGPATRYHLWVVAQEVFRYLRERD